MNNWNNSFCSNRQYLLSRRDILKGISAGFGYMAFAGMSTAQAAAETPLAPKRPHFQPKAKRVIFCCMRGLTTNRPSSAMKASSCPSSATEN